MFDGYLFNLYFYFFLLTLPPPPRSTLFPYTTLFRSRLGANTIFSLMAGARELELTRGTILIQVPPKAAPVRATTGSALGGDRKSTRLNSSHQIISYAVFCLKKKKNHI